MEDFKTPLEIEREILDQFSEDFKSKGYLYYAICRNVIIGLIKDKSSIETIEFLLREILKVNEINSMLIQHTTSFNIEFTKQEIERINDKYKKPE